ncbi:MAG TPA: ABC transporter ATP-binding protein, partial [Micromonospora sp.]
MADAAQVRAYAASLLRRHPRALAGVIGLHAAGAVTGLAAPRLLGDLGEAVSQGTGRHTVDRIALLIAVFVVGQTILVRVANLASARLGERVLAELREEFVDRVLAIPLATVERAGTGDLLTRTSRDVAALSHTVRFAVPETLIALVTVVMILGALVLTGPLLLLPSLVAVPLLWAGTRWYLRRAGDAYLRENAAYSDVTDGISETVEGSRTTEALRQQARRRARTDADIRRSWLAERYTLFLRTVFFPVAEIGYVVPVVATLLAGGWFHIEGWASLGQVTAATLYVQQLIDPITRLLGWLDELQVGGASMARLLGVTTLPDGRAAVSAPLGDERVEVSVAPGGSAQPAGTGERTGPSTGQDLTVREVRYAYQPGRDVLHGVDLVVRPGERLAVVGPSGAGKSTLGRLLAGIHAPRAGSVTVGGVPLTSLPPDDLRANVALVTQEHHVFIGTLRDNVALARPGAAEAEVRAALAAVDALDWVDELPAGLDTV